MAAYLPLAGTSSDIHQLDLRVVVPNGILVVFVRIELLVCIRVPKIGCYGLERGFLIETGGLFHTAKLQQGLRKIFTKLPKICPKLPFDWFVTGKHGKIEQKSDKWVVVSREY